jgi:CRP-like cAMP-binding protein
MEAAIDRELVTRLASVPLFADLDLEERADVVLGLRLMSFGSGEALMRQGTKADGAYFILDGQVQVTMMLPGGGETLIAELGPGSPLGELAMIRSGPRNATVTATCPVEAIYADWRFLNAALAQLRPGAFKVFRQLAVVLAGRLRGAHESIRKVVMGNDRPYEMMKLSSATGDALKCEAPREFDADAFLSILPCFNDFEPSAIQAVRARSKILDVQRGHQLVLAGQSEGNVYVVVRGAVASGFFQSERIHLVNVRGPGCFCNASSLIDGGPASTSYITCEKAVLLEIPRDQFFVLFRTVDRTAKAFLSATIEHQAAMVARATNHLARLVGLSRLFHQLKGDSAASLIDR